MLSTLFLPFFRQGSKLLSRSAFMSGMKANKPVPSNSTGPEDAAEYVLIPDDALPGTVVGLQGVHWRDGIYLVPTSEIDGHRRWETIILLLAQKLQDRQFRDALLTLRAAKREG